jgi:selT/selW/selH-like putative selenoprotein|tara:strand:+ start:152040 stop:152183 length:144 start_codon:yes stop_codon:yes gene_type:complete
LEVELLPGSEGIFDVELDGELIFSKHQAGERFPERDEVEGFIRSKIS